MIKNISLITFLIFVLASSKPLHAQQNKKDISDLFKYGYLLVDSNSDSLIDVVNGKIVIPKQPTEAEIIAAANIAARLGYETTAMDLDLVRFAGDEELNKNEVSIIIGNNNDFTSLAPSQGIIKTLDEKNV